MLEIGEAKSLFDKSLSTTTPYLSAIYYWSYLTLLPRRQSALLVVLRELVKPPLIHPSSEVRNTMEHVVSDLLGRTFRCPRVNVPVNQPHLHFWQQLGPCIGSPLQTLTAT